MTPDNPSPDSTADAPGPAMPTPEEAAREWLGSWFMLPKNAEPGNLRLVTLTELLTSRDAQIRERALAWRPIESAPRDGTLMLVAGGELDRPTAAFWSVRFKRWVCDGGYPYVPAYWQPLPPLPQTQQMKEEG